jgi:hypothetical protein
MYMYCGMADVAALLGLSEYVRALDRLWEDEVSTKLALSGGIGARRQGEAFGEAYELPNASAYNETCAAIGNAMWNHRMALLHGDARYVDVLERIIYNGVPSGVSLSGDRFFYPNPLASAGSYHRSPWFDCSCCPVNVVRFLPSIAGYVYAHDEEGIFVNLYVSGTGRVRRAGHGTVTMRQESRYPWDGSIRVVVEPEQAHEFELRLRVPGWASGRPVPGDLYTYLESGSEPPPVTLAVNGQRVERIELKRGYATIERTWQRGDTVELTLPMAIRRVLAHERVEADRGRVALERGPIVYCIEGADTDGRVRHLWLPDGARLSTEHRSDLLGGVSVITGTAAARERGADGATIETREIPFTAIPYCVWDNREAGEMAVWLPRTADGAEVLPAPTVASTSRASASHCFEHDTVEALHDQIEPESSQDHVIPRLTWWDHRGTTEWVQYDFARPTRVQSVSVYWFDDTGVGECRLPLRWRVLFRDGEKWKPVGGAGTHGVEPDVSNTVRFDPVVTAGLRLEVELRPGFSGGILEWKVE